MRQIEKLQDTLGSYGGDSRIKAFPTEIFTHIFHYLSTPQVARLQRVSKQWRRMIRSEPSLWRRFTFDHSPPDGTHSKIYALENTKILALEKCLFLARSRITSLQVHLPIVHKKTCIKFFDMVPWDTLTSIDVNFTSPKSRQIEAEDVLREAWPNTWNRIVHRDNVNELCLSMPSEPGHNHRLPVSRDSRMVQCRPWKVKLANFVSLEPLVSDGALGLLVSAASCVVLSVQKARDLSSSGFWQVLQSAPNAIETLDFEVKQTTEARHATGDDQGIATSPKLLRLPKLHSIRVSLPHRLPHAFSAYQLAAAVEHVELRGSANTLLVSSFDTLFTERLRHLCLELNANNSSTFLHILPRLGNLATLTLDAAFDYEGSATLSILEILSSHPSIAIEELQIKTTPARIGTPLRKVIACRLGPSTPEDEAQQRKPIRKVILSDCSSLDGTVSAWLRSVVETVSIFSTR